MARIIVARPPVAFPFPTIAGTGTVTSGTTDWEGFTISQYVAPFASVPGATDDDDDMGSAAWTAASSISTPTTIGTAIRRATAGNNVGLFQGTYLRTIAQSGATATIPVFNPANSGSSGNPIRFIGQYRCTRASVSSGNYTELRNGVVPGTGDGAPTFGITGRSYCEWHNIYVDQAVSSGNPGVSVDGALATIRGSGTLGNAIIGCYLHGVDDDYNGTNFSGVIFAEGTYGRVENCIIEDIIDSTGNQNVAGFHMFTTNNNTVTHNIFRNSNSGAYIKFDHGGIGMYAIDVGYNVVDTMSNHGFKIGDPSTGTSTLNYMRHNLFLDTENAINPAFANNNPDGPKDWRIYNNTIVGCDYMVRLYSGMQTGAYENFHFYNNLVSLPVRIWQDDGASAATFATYVTNGLRMNYNLARAPSSNWGRLSGGSNYADPAAWAAAFGGGGSTPMDNNSQVVSPDQFVDAAGGDYRLNTGVAALTAGNTGGVDGSGADCPVGCYITGSEEIGLEAGYA